MQMDKKFVVKFTKSWHIIDRNGEIVEKYSVKDYMTLDGSWTIINPPPRDKFKKYHPAPFPEKLIELIIRFFASQFFNKRKNIVILDPFMGSGTTIIEAIKQGHIGVGIELEEHYYNLAKERIKQVGLLNSFIGEKKRYYLFNEDARNILEIWKKHSLPKVDLIITSPPYWIQLKKNTLRQKDRVLNGLPTDYSDNPKNLGNIADYNEFLKELTLIFYKIYHITRNRGYLIVIINNIYHEGLNYPLAFDLLIHLSYLWVPLDEKLWLQDNKKLLPLGNNRKWLANRHHHYMLVFQKDISKLNKLQKIFEKRIKVLDQLVKLAKSIDK